MNDQFIKAILKEIYCHQILSGKGPSLSDLVKKLKVDDKIIRNCINYLINKKLIKPDLTLTSTGRRKIKVGLTGGVFDILHLGHIETLKKAKEIVDVLVVVIARNTTVEKLKGRSAIMDELDRLKIISSIKYVDFAMLGSEKDFMEPVNLIKPDVIILGYDQSLPPNLTSKIPQKKVVRLNVQIKHRKTSSFLNKIKNM